MRRISFRLFSLFLSVALSAWLLPLGAFIKPSQEKIACGGNRAMHMCSMNDPARVNTDTSDKVTFSSAGAERTQKPPASDDGLFLSAGNGLDAALDTASMGSDNHPFSFYLLIRPIDPIPLIQTLR